MSPNDFDIGPLTWVKSEIDAALNSARENLAEVQQHPEQREPLRFAQNHVHQASGALSVVGLDGVAQFSEAIDKLLSAMAADEAPPAIDKLSLANRGLAVLANYINELLAGAPHQPLRLYPMYAELVTARGSEAPPPSELFFPDLSVRPTLAQGTTVEPERLAVELRVLRSRFEKGLLAWIRKPSEATGPEQMLRAVKRIEQIQAMPATRAFWWAAIAFFEGLAQGVIVPDRQAHRLCRRIDTQMRRLIEGSQVVAERLVRDVLYFVATAQIDTDHAHAVRTTYRLDSALPPMGSELSDTLRQPLASRLREALEGAKELWNRFSGGTAAALPQFQEQYAEVVARAAPMHIPQVDRLLNAMGSVISWLRADPLRVNEALAMEVATGMLVVEHAAESIINDPQLLRKQVDLLCERYAARCQGKSLPPLDDSILGAASQRVQEKQFFNQLAREILINLGQIEQTLDAFFRNPAQRETLSSLSSPIKQIEGAFAMLGEQAAVQLMRDSAAQVTRFAESETPPEQAECDEVAHKLSALGFYVDALKTGPAKLEHFLDPESAKADEAQVAAVSGTVEAQLVRETRETHSLMEAFNEAPQDAALRNQLVSNLEAIREDAQLVADAQLEQHAKEAIASLKAGDATSAQLQEALAITAPAAAPQPSAEAARLMSVSSEELDAELLGIFLEEAKEVLDTIAEFRNKAAATPNDHDALTTVRRGFHTLKGSSRMVGLNDFSEPARHVEMTMNRWLQLEKDADAELVALIDEAHSAFTAWVVQLDAGGSVWRDASALIQHAERVLAGLDPAPDDVAPLPGGPPPKERPLGKFARPAEPSQSVKLEPGEPVSSGLDFDFDVDLPELASERGASNQTHEAALEETHFDMPSLESLGLDEAALPETDDDPELDLTSTQMSGDLLSSIGSEDISEIDLSETMIDGIPLFGGMDEPSLDVQRMPGAATRPSSPPVKVEADDEIHVVHKDEDITTTALDFELPSDDETDTEPLSLGVEPLPTFQETGLDGIRLESGDESITTTALDFELPNEGPDHPEPSALNVDPVASPEAFLNTPFTTYSAPGSSTETAGPVEAPAATAANIPTSSPARSDDGLEEVSIDDDDFDIELPRINMKVLGSAEPSPAEEDPPEPEPAAPNDTEVVIGDHTLSRGLYELYMNEARQHLSTLHDEQERLEGNPLRIPSMESIRAAHTLAGISGTARIDPAHTLGKALEHAQNRFHEVSRAPDPYQVALMGAALRTLEDMVSAIARLQMPLEVPELIDQLVELKPVFDSAPLPPVVDVPDLDASTTTMAYDTAELPTEAGDEPATALPTPASEVANAQEVYDEPVAAEPEVSTVQDELDEQLLPIFFEEADELTEEMSGTLRQLRTEPTDSGAQQALARVLHTLKGSARMAGAMRLGEYVHALESRMEHMQAGSTMVDEMENGLDHIGTMLEALRNPAAETPAVVEEAADHDVAMAEDGVVPPSSSVQTRPTAQIVEPVETPEAPQQQERRSTLRVRADVVDRFVNEAGEISIARTRVEGEMRTLRRSLLDLTENVIRLRNQLREIEIQAESQMQSRIAAAESQHANFDPLEFDRFTRLQEVTRMMAESVGDVTTIQQNLLRNLDSADFALHAQGRLSRDLQQALMTVRMVPFEETVDRLYRVVRQTAKELGKRANLDVRNGSIEIDRGVLDKMVAPLEHLLRNAIAHGIEMPEERTAAGKPEFGQITLTLHQLSNEIALDLSDDGRGLNYERILARGRKVGLVGADETPTENRLTQLIFEPGFSTAETVSGIAGRGVGMDVVKNEALAVGGRIDVSSTPGQGARFLIHLPLTLAVTQALLVRASGRTYAIPSNMVEQALELKETPLQNVRSQGFVEWKDQQYPFRYLPRLLGDTVTQPVPGRYHWVLLLRAGNQTLAMHIDELRGNQEVIVKNAGPQFVRLQGFTGATVLPDGEIALIINPVILAGRTAAQIEADELQPQAVAEVAHVPLIMVVDDSLTVRKITSRLLEREGYRVVTAKDGVDALEQLGEVMPDVVLTDIEMPRMDGFDLARNIRADERLGRLPLIMITSRMADKHREYAREIGVNHYLGKPFQEDILLELIQSFVQK